MLEIGAVWMGAGRIGAVSVGTGDSWQCERVLGIGAISKGAEGIVGSVDGC